eukprot:TRINITY_DN2220_c0_g1_i8.p1 TRINITY_DN2220_c0_g1~~TRINITY_DN2220_c0_g1_i8.p1  ORF type:complete len:421 (+),score=43.57 TRINITY_DN2220_c0_g1_i8:113-1375(+)
MEVGVVGVVGVTAVKTAWDAVLAARKAYSYIVTRRTCGKTVPLFASAAWAHIDELREEQLGHFLTSVPTETQMRVLDLLGQALDLLKIYRDKSGWTSFVFGDTPADLTRVGAALKIVGDVADQIRMWEIAEGIQGLRQELRQEFQGLRQEFQGLRQELRQEFQGLRQELRQEFQGLRQDLHTERKQFRLHYRTEPGHVLCMVGDALGGWTPQPLNYMHHQGDGWWQLTCPMPPMCQYKFLVVDAATAGAIRWEGGPNRRWCCWESPSCMVPKVGGHSSHARWKRAGALLKVAIFNTRHTTRVPDGAVVCLGRLLSERNMRWGDGSGSGGSGGGIGMAGDDEGAPQGRKRCAGANCGQSAVHAASASAASAEASGEVETRKEVMLTRSEGRMCGEQRRPPQQCNRVGVGMIKVRLHIGTVQ